MDDSFFLLVRYYLRVDGVVVRILDTRIYHEFGSDHLIREFKHLESDYDMLRGKGFSPSSEWMLSETQADEASGFLKLRK
jgi:type 2A phosphatase activator TIP41